MQLFLPGSVGGRGGGEGLGGSVAYVSCLASQCEQLEVLAPQLGVLSTAGVSQ